eukprot:2071853-Alexandrium_andersonii.AAC.1
MSASLVGSEMCIRDRARSAHLTEAIRWMRRRTSASWGRVQPSGGAAEGCLLYTSDAADDM